MGLFRVFHQSLTAMEAAWPCVLPQLCKMPVVRQVFDSVKVDGNITRERVLKLFCRELCVRVRGKLLQGDRLHHTYMHTHSFSSNKKPGWIATKAICPEKSLGDSELVWSTHVSILPPPVYLWGPLLGWLFLLSYPQPGDLSQYSSCIHLQRLCRVRSYF